MHRSLTRMFPSHTPFLSKKTSMFHQSLTCMFRVRMLQYKAQIKTSATSKLCLEI